VARAREACDLALREPGVVERPPERLRFEHHAAHPGGHRAVGEPDSDYAHPPLHCFPLSWSGGNVPDTRVSAHVDVPKLKPMRKEDLILVSVDDHVVEPPDVFEHHLPAKYKDIAPRIEHRADGTDAWKFLDFHIPNVGLNAVAGRPPEEY